MNHNIFRLVPADTVCGGSSSASRSFVLAALRALHLDPGSGPPPEPGRNEAKQGKQPMDPPLRGSPTQIRTESSLTSKHLADDNSVWATGHFLNKRSGSQSDMTGWEFPRPRRSSENAKYVQNATRSAEGAHAEEQVTNQFEQLYQVILGQLKREGIGLPQRHSTLSSASTSPLVTARTAQSTLLTS